MVPNIVRGVSLTNFSSSVFSQSLQISNTNKIGVLYIKGLNISDEYVACMHASLHNRHEGAKRQYSWLRWRVYGFILLQLPFFEFYIKETIL